MFGHTSGTLPEILFVQSWGSHSGWSGHGLSNNLIYYNIICLSDSTYLSAIVKLPIILCFTACTINTHGLTIIFVLPPALLWLGLKPFYRCVLVFVHSHGFLAEILGKYACSYVQLFSVSFSNNRHTSKLGISLRSGDK